jgi:uncharacterized protein YpbB
MSRPDRERAWACDRTALTQRQLADTYQRGNVERLQQLRRQGETISDCIIRVIIVTQYRRGLR